MMPANDILVVHIVVNGSPFQKTGRENSAIAGRMLLQAFRCDSCWPRKAAFVITPGGFIQAPFPKYDGRRGWCSRRKDFDRLIPCARKAIEDIVTMEARD